jgi:hypothetical protein
VFFQTKGVRMKKETKEIKTDSKMLVLYRQTFKDDAVFSALCVELGFNASENVILIEINPNN